LRIAHFTPYFQPQLGYEEYCLPKKQRDAGNEVCIVTSDRYFPFPDFEHSVGYVLGSRKVGSGLFSEDGVMVHRLPCLFEWGAGILVYGLKKVLRNFAPDIVHAHQMLYPSSVLLAFIKSSVGYKLVVDESMIIDDFPRTPWKHLAYLTYKKLAFPLLSKEGDWFIAKTPAVLRWLQEKLNVDSRLITLVPLGADADLFRPHEQFRIQYRRLLHLRRDEVLVTYAGKLLPDKDIDILIKGIAPLMKKYGNIKVLLLGSGGKKYVSEILGLAGKYNIRKNLILHKLVGHEELAKFYNASDIGVWLGKPSITIIEAMASGLPIVLAKSEQTCHLLADNGFAFSRGNPHELEICLARLIQDEKSRYQMGLSAAGGRVFVQQSFHVLGNIMDLMPEIRKGA